MSVIKYFKTYFLEEKSIYVLRRTIIPGIVMSFVIIFDIPRSEMTERRIHRGLVRGGAIKIYKTASGEAIR